METEQVHSRINNLKTLYEKQLESEVLYFKNYN